MQNFEKKGLILDCSHNGVPTVSHVEKIMSIMQKLGLNTLQMYMEDVFHLEGYINFGFMRGKYSLEELKNIDDLGKKYGIEVIPAVQAFGDMGSLGYWEQNGYLFGYGDATYKMIEDILKTMSECFSSKNIVLFTNADGDMSLYKKITGKVKEELFELYTNHLNKVLDVCKKIGYDKPVLTPSCAFCFGLNGKEPVKYQDDIENVFINDENIRLMPKDFAISYNEKGYSLDENFAFDRINDLKLFGNELVYFGSSVANVGFVPCNEFAIDSLKKRIKFLSENGVKDVYLALWTDNGKECSFLNSLPTIYAFSEFIKGNFDFDKQGFYSLTGISFDDFMKVDLGNKVDDNPVLNHNPSKYFLYGDPFIGLTEDMAKDGVSAIYKEYALELKPLIKNTEYGYLFDNLYNLCLVLEYKAELAKKTRAFYKAGDKKALKNLAKKDYTICKKRVENLYKSFKTLWYKENKTFGFEVQDVHFGGLILRLQTAKERILSYLSGTSDKILELEENTLDFLDRKDSKKQEQITVASWGDIISPSAKF